MDKLPPEARALLDAASRADDPTPTARARADARVRDALAREGLQGLPPLAPPRSTIEPIASTSAGLRGALALTLGAGAVVVAAVVIGVRSAQRGPASDTSAPAPLNAPTPARAPAPPVAPAKPETAPVPVPAAQRSSESVDPPQPHKQVRTARATARAQPASAIAGDDSALQRELGVLASADQLVRAARFSDALALLERTEPGNARHAMREERAALRVLCLCGKALDEDALRERDRFLAASPQSLLASRVRTECTRRGEGER